MASSSRSSSRSSSSVINFPDAGGGTSIITIIIGIITIVALVYFFKKNFNFIRNLMGGKIGVAADAVCATGPHVYQTVGSPMNGGWCVLKMVNGSSTIFNW